MTYAKATPQTAPAPLPEDNDLLGVQQAAALLPAGYSPQTLYNLRHRGTGPECLMVKGRLKYRRSALLEWAAKAETEPMPEPAAMTTAEVLALPPSVDLETACRVFPISPATGYRLVKSGSFPCPVVRLGRSIRVPKAGLLRVLGLDAADRSATGA
jgi:predicted DNA-binding transcriptional regulator AlpA